MVACLCRQSRNSDSTCRTQFYGHPPSQNVCPRTFCLYKSLVAKGRCCAFIMFDGCHQHTNCASYKALTMQSKIGICFDFFIPKETSLYILNCLVFINMRCFFVDNYGPTYALEKRRYILFDKENKYNNLWYRDKEKTK